MPNQEIITNHTLIEATQVLKQDIYIYTIYSVMSPRKRENVHFKLLPNTIHEWSGETHSACR